MRVGIVGGGITGLSVLHFVRAAGEAAVCYEASPRPGGVIHSTLTDGRVLEHGPQRLRLTEPVEALIEAVGLEDEVLEGDDRLPIYVYADGALRVVPRSIRSFLRTDLLSRRGKLRVLAEPLTAPGRPEESAAELFARKFGEEAYRNLVGPIFGGMYASDPARMPARHALSGLLAVEESQGSLLRAALSRASGQTPPPASFTDGLQALPDAIAATHADALELDTAVTGIESDGNGYALETEAGTDVVDRVVLTVPGPAAADLLAEVAPAASEPLAGLTYNPLVLVHLAADAEAAGFGYQVHREAGLRTLGVTWNASLFDRQGVYTAFLGGMTDPAVLELDDGSIGTLAAREFETVMDAPADPVNVTRLERGFPAYDATWDALADLSLPPDVTLATNYTARMGIPSRIREARTLGEALLDTGQ